MSEPNEVLAAIIDPARREVARLTQEIQELETQTRAKRDELKTYERVLRAASPDTPRPGPKGVTPLKAAAPATIDRVLEFLRAHEDVYANGDGFTATSLTRDLVAAGQGASSQTINLVCHELREREAIRLLKRGTGGSRIYRLVKA